jgi:hypothetical protein
MPAIVHDGPSGIADPNVSHAQKQKGPTFVGPVWG